LMMDDVESWQGTYTSYPEEGKAVRAGTDVAVVAEGTVTVAEED
jgi:hypothetical protein